MKGQRFDAIAHFGGYHRSHVSKAAQYGGLMSSHLTAANNQNFGITNTYIDRKEIHLLISF